jgi:MoaA/NifB/PqqE/SkfB family radical SAM enzyme
MKKPKAAERIIGFAIQWREDMQKRLQAKQQGLMAVDTYVIEPTDKCNLNCPGCYANSTARGDSLPYELIELIDDEMKDAGTTLTTISGGEPFLAEKKYKTITRLAEHALNRGNYGGFLVYTNGTLINEDTAKKLGELGNIWPAISVEGSDNSTKKRRGRGIIEKIQKATDNLNKYGVMHGFSVTATKENAHEIADDKFFQTQQQRGANFGWVFLLQPIGRNPNPDLMVTGEQRYEIGKTVMNVQISRDDISLFLGDFWNYGPFVEGCIAGGKRYYHIMAGGNVSPCVFSPFGAFHLKDIESLSEFYPESEKKFENLQDAITRNSLFCSYRKAQEKITDRMSPCVLIDHPELARKVFSNSCFKTKNTPDNYLKGEIADTIDQRSEEWKNIWAPKLKQYADNLINRKLEK